MFKEPIAQQLVVDGSMPSPLAIPAASVRFASHCDEKNPSLVFNEEGMAIARNIFTAGMFRPKSLFDQVVHDYLFMSTEQNKALHQNLDLEQTFANTRKEKRYGHIFHFQSQITRVIKNL